MQGTQTDRHTRHTLNDVPGCIDVHPKLHDEKMNRREITIQKIFPQVTLNTIYIQSTASKKKLQHTKFHIKNIASQL